MSAHFESAAATVPWNGETAQTQTQQVMDERKWKRRRFACAADVVLVLTLCVSRGGSRVVCAPCSTRPADAATDRDVGEATKTKKDEPTNITAQTCFTDGLHAIFSFLPLIDFASSSAVCRRWAAAANSQPMRGDELTVGTELDLRAAQRSCLWRHVSVLIYDPPIGAPDMRCIMRAAIIAALQSSSSITDIRFAKLLDFSDDVKALTTALAASTTLTSWSISHNRVELTASAALSSAIRTSRALKSIALHNLVMLDDCVIALAEAIKASPTLTSVSLHSNLLNHAGESALAAAQREVQLRQISMAQHVDDIQSQDEARQIQGATAIRNMLMVENPPIQQVIDAEVVPRLIEFLQKSQSPVLQIESAWALTNIASGTSRHTRAVIDMGAIPVFVALLSSQSDGVKDQAVWALGNIAGESAECRDQILAAGALKPLLALCMAFMSGQGNISLLVLRNALWCLMNLCRGTTKPSMALMPALPVLARLISVRDDEIATNACWALYFLSTDDGQTPEKRKTRPMVQLEVVPQLVVLLSHENSEVRHAALNIVGNICAGGGEQTVAVLNCKGVLARLRAFLEDSDEKVRTSACLAISNITSGSATQIQLVIDADIVPLLVAILHHDELDVKEQAAYAISNAVSSTEEQIRYFALQGAHHPLSALLDNSDQQFRSAVMQILERLSRFEGADGVNGS